MKKTKELLRKITMESSRMDTISIIKMAISSIIPLETLNWFHHQNTLNDISRKPARDRNILYRLNTLIVQGKKLLIVYKPQSVPDCRNTLAYWREYCLQHGVGDIYILGCWTADVPNDLIEKGFDAAGEFQPGSILPYCEKINQKLPLVRSST